MIFQLKRYIIIALTFLGVSGLYGQDLKSQKATLLLDSFKKASSIDEKLSIYNSKEVQELDANKSLISLSMASDIASVYFEKGDKENSLYWLKVIEKSPIIYTWTWPIFYNKFFKLGDFEFLDKALFMNMEGIHDIIRDSVGIDNKLFAEYSRKLYPFIETKLSLNEKEIAYRHLDLLYKKYRGFQDNRNYVQYIKLMGELDQKNELLSTLVSLYTSGKQVPKEIDFIKDQVLISSAFKTQFESAVAAEQDNQRKNFKELITVSNELYGKDISQAVAKSKFIILSFWGTWCVPCIESHPHLLKIYSQYKKQGLEVISLASETGKNRILMIANLKKSIENQKLPWLHTMLEGHHLPVHPYSKYRIEGYPTKILIDNQGVIIGKYTGESEIAILESKLNELFGQ